MATKKVIKFESQVSPAEPDDVHKGWIRVSDDLRNGVPNGAYIKVIANNRKVYCQVRGTPGKARRVEINEWYRNIFGWTDPPNEVIEFTIKEVCSFGRIRAWSLHPDDIVRVGIGLGIISVGLGSLSMIMAILPPSIRLMAGGNLFDSIWGIVSLVVGLILIPLVIFLLSTGLWIFLRKFPKPIDRKDP